MALFLFIVLSTLLSKGLFNITGEGNTLPSTAIPIHLLIDKLILYDCYGDVIHVNVRLNTDIINLQFINNNVYHNSLDDELHIDYSNVPVNTKDFILLNITNEYYQ
eukprot:415410_1